MAETVGVRAFRDPLAAQASWLQVPHGATLEEIAADAFEGVPFGVLVLRGAIARGGQSWEVPRERWARVRPAAGSVVTLAPAVEGPLAAAIPLLAGAGAQWLGATVLGLSGIGLNLFVAGATILGQLAANALVPPAPQPEEEMPRYFLGGSSNRSDPYGPIPRVFGRHVIYPPLSAAGYTESVGEDTFLRARFCFGYGPLALEGLRIGTTPIHEFSDWTIEFRNIDRTETLALHPELNSPHVYWKADGEQMHLYSQNIAEDFPGAAVNRDAPVSRETRSESTEAIVTLAYQGLAEISKEGDIKPNDVRVRYRWRDARVAGSGWAGEATRTFTGRTRQMIQFAHRIALPYASRWEVETTVLSIKETGPRDLFDGTLASIKSVRTGGLPLPSGIAEMTLRVRATEQLNGRLDQVNAVAHAMLPIRAGGTWTPPIRTRHPGAAWAALLRGGTGHEALPDGRLDLVELDAWFGEPWWTFDAVLADGTIADGLRDICAAGRRRPMVTGLRHQPMPDRAKDHVRGFYSPHNSRNFELSQERWEDIHGFRVRVISEKKDWQPDEIVVYADGYSRANATELPEMELPGVVITKDDGDQGNPYRLARYHLAQAILRRETITFESGIDHLAHQVGDKLRITRDVVQFGVGAGRVTRTEVVDGRLARVWIDEPHDGAEAGERVERIEVESGSEAVGVMSLDGADVAVIEPEAGYKLRMRVRQPDGSGEATLTVARPDGLGRDWTVLDAEADPDAAHRGDLVLIEALAEEPVDVIVRQKEALDDLGARLTCVLAAPAVLDADVGTIPPYDPFLTPLRVVQREPDPPVIRELASDERTMIRERDNTVKAAISARVVPADGLGPMPAFKALRWRVAAGEWQTTPWLPLDAGTITTGPLVEGVEYEVIGVTRTADGMVSGPSPKRTITARALSAPPPDVTGLVLTLGAGGASLTWDRQADAFDVRGYEVRFSTQADATWRTAQLVTEVAWPMNTTPIPARTGAYLVRGVDHGGRYSDGTAKDVITGDAVADANVVETLDLEAWSGAMTDVRLDGAGDLELIPEGEVYPELGIYDHDGEIDLGADYPCHVATRPVISGRTASALPLRLWPALKDMGPISGADPNLYSVDAQMQVRRGGVWSDWQPVTGGVVVGAGFRFRLLLRSVDGTSTPVVRAFRVVVDMPDRVVPGTASAPATGLSVSFEAPFKEVPIVLATPLDAPAGVTAKITNKSRSGFDILWRDAGGTPVAQDFDFTAHGYGKEAA